MMIEASSMAIMNARLSMTGAGAALAAWMRG